MIVTSLKLGQSDLSVSQYRQMIGRAGRLGFDVRGQSVLVCRPSEKSKALRMVNSVPERIKSCLLGTQRGMCKFVLESICARITVNEHELMQFMKSSLLFVQLAAHEEEEPPQHCSNRNKVTASRENEEENTL